VDPSLLFWPWGSSSRLRVFLLTIALPKGRSSVVPTHSLMAMWFRSPVFFPPLIFRPLIKGGLVNLSAGFWAFDASFIFIFFSFPGVPAHQTLARPHSSSQSRSFVTFLLLFWFFFSLFDRDFEALWLFPFFLFFRMRSLGNPITSSHFSFLVGFPSP